MALMYDLILNFQNEYYDFYEWNNDDFIWHIKKISLVKVDASSYDDFLRYDLVLSSLFVESIMNKSEYFTKKGVTILPYAFLLTDSYRVMGIILDDNRKVVKYSSLLLDEEEEVLETSNKLPLINLQYERKGKKQINNLTREEIRVQSYICKELKKTKELNKLKYLYYEYFGTISNNNKEIKGKLLSEVENNFNEKHLNQYNLIKLSLHQNNV